MAAPQFSEAYLRGSSSAGLMRESGLHFCPIFIEQFHKPYFRCQVVYPYGTTVIVKPFFGLILGRERESRQAKIKSTPDTAIITILSMKNHHVTTKTWYFWFYKKHGY